MRKRILAAAVMVCMMVLSAWSASAADSDYNYVVGGRGKKQIPVSYTVENVFSRFGERTVALDHPQDMFIDTKTDRIYVLDTGHARIVILNKDGSIYKDIYPEGQAALKEPSGIYVDADGDMYVADTENGRVVHLGLDGQFIEEFIQPNSALYDTSYAFKPIKVALDAQGQIYVLNRDDYHGFIKLNAYNEFSGYIASTKVTTSLIDKLVELIASETQQDLLGGKTPAVHTNIFMMQDNTFYATTARTGQDQIKHFTSIGNNFYVSGKYGDDTTDYVTKYFGSSGEETQRFVDICVDENGIISALDGVNGRIFQYDQDGSMLTAFGGTGNWSGRFRKAVAIGVDSEGLIYVLDSTIGNIQVFRPTKFMNTVHKALGLYLDGKYEEAMEPWEEILKADRSYYVAHLGIGKVYLKQEKWPEAMEQYKIINDQALYSQAFAGFRKDWIRQNFLWVVLIPVLLIIGAVLLVSRLSRLAKRTQVETEVSGFRIGLNVIFSPWDGFTFITRYREKFSYCAPTLILLFILASRIGLAFLEHYPLAAMEPQYRNFFQEITVTVVPFITFVICLYLVTAIMEGETKLREVYAAMAYSLLPLAIFQLPLGLLSRILTQNEAGLYNLLWMIVYIWCAILAIISIQSMNSYKLRQVFLRVGIALLACLFIWCVVGLIYILLNKLFTFFYDVFMQNKLYYFG